MRRVSVILVMVGLGAGCAPVPRDVEKPEVGVGNSGQIRPVARPTELKPPKKPPANARTAAQFDTTTAEEKKAAEVEAIQAQKSGEGRLLGRTVASIGDPSQPGLWIKTPLVDGPAKGRVIYPANGKAVQVDLIPIDGPKTAGSRMSLAALRVIEAPLAGLPEVDVYKE